MRLNSVFGLVEYILDIPTDRLSGIPGTSDSSPRVALKKSSSDVKDDEDSVLVAESEHVTVQKIYGYYLDVLFLYNPKLAARFDYSAIIPKEIVYLTCAL